MLPFSTYPLSPPSATPSRKCVKMHIEHRPPPLKLTKQKLSLIQEKQAYADKHGLLSPFSRIREVRYPNREINRYLDKNSILEPKFLIDTPENPIISQLFRLKQDSLIEGTFHNRFWIPNPSAIDAESFYIKAGTYLFNLDHKGRVNSKG